AVSEQQTVPEQATISETTALETAASETTIPETIGQPEPQDSPFNVPAEGLETLSDDQLGEFSEEDALHAAFEEQRELDGTLPEQESEAGHAVEAETLDVTAMDDEQYQVAGLDMDALLSDPDLQDIDHPIPEEESAVWNAEQTPGPEIESEDWSEQPHVLGEDVADLEFDTDLDSLLEEGQSELLETSEEDNPYISIEELMKDDGEPQADPDAQPIDLNVGLDDFPDMLSEIEPYDVDKAGDVANDMDLAKAYLEMNDVDGARALLEKVMASSDLELKNEAKEIMEKLH
ncbi:FimV/HubP family polar landmark protein, partial [Veronia pacifica]